MTGRRKVDKVLQPAALSYVRRRGRLLYFHDNAQTHARSPNLNPIERVWGITGRRLQRYPGPSANVQHICIEAN